MTATLIQEAQAALAAARANVWWDRAAVMTESVA